MSDPHIPTAAEIRARSEFIGSHRAQEEAKDAIVAWAKLENDIHNEAVGRKFLASEKRTLMRCMESKDELSELLKDFEPVYKHDGDAGDVMRSGGGFGSSPFTTAESGILEPEVWAKQVADAFGRLGKAAGVKAVVSGSLDAPAVLADAVGDPQTATSLLQLIPRKGLGENNFAYLRQVVRTNNAAPVADGATKPTSVFTFLEEEDKAQVVAHLTEPFPVRFLQDHAELVRLLRSELAYGLQVAIEDQVVNGDGVAPNFGGLLTVAGTTAVPFATDVPTTLRKSRTAMTNLGETPTAFVLNPTDVEGLDLLREDGATGDFLSLEDRILGRLPVVPSLAVPAGTGILADWRQTRLYVREQMRIDSDASGALFDRNEMKFRAEMRANVAALRPQAVGIIDLSAA